MSVFKKQRFEMGDGLEFWYDPKTKWINVKLNGQKSRIRKTELWQLAFMISGEEKQDELLPAKKITMMQFDRIHTIKATKDIKKDETIQFHCHVDVPKVVVEHLLSKETSDTHLLEQKESIQ